ncbi:hypothetical protein VM98_30115 [Streptomyces rubellomurinus subsp. indigoferus]|nr:hypothetical protein VM98_30115 [Streptomyces rubellomurinus subsp. indigoferus]
MPRLRRHTLSVATALLALLGTGTPAVAATPEALAGAVRAPVAGHQHGGGLRNSTSSNWSGYAATGGPFTSVGADWVQPAVSCTDTDAYSAFWVGLDGDTSRTVEQIGSSADCSSGSPVYYAWYEMYPQYPTNFPDTVAPGDHLTGSVTTDGAGKFTLTLSDTTQGWTRTIDKSLKSAKLASAEVIAEAPVGLFDVLPLANFGTVAFTGATANGQSLGASNPSVIDMAKGGVTKATTSPLANGTDFAVTWQHS